MISCVLRTLTVGIQPLVQAVELPQGSENLDHSDPVLFLAFVGAESLTPLISCSKIH